MICPDCELAHLVDVTEHGDAFQRLRCLECGHEEHLQPGEVPVGLLPNGAPPIIVTGTGRSGTSVTARILHTRLGVAMAPDDDLLDPGGQASPGGTFEDVEIRQLHIEVQKGDLTLPGFRIRMLELARKRDHQLWGWKDPRACHVLGLHLQWFRGVTVIVCRRNLDSVTASVHRHYHTDPVTARREMARRSDQLEALLTWRVDVHWLGFDQRRSEEELELQLLPIVAEHRARHFKSVGA